MVIELILKARADAEDEKTILDSITEKKLNIEPFINDCLNQLLHCLQIKNHKNFCMELVKIILDPSEKVV